MSNRIHHEVKSTKDRIALFTMKFALDGVTGSIINSTDTNATLSGTGPTATDATGGRLTITMGSTNTYPHIYHWAAEVHSATGYVGVYRLEPISGSALAGQFIMRLMSGSDAVAGNAPPGLGVYGMTAAVKATAGLTGSVFAVLHNSSR
jgi:hypothetical protein